ncbi:hypothetical protein GCM10010431_72870 [Streptomyces kunmingensis]
MVGARPAAPVPAGRHAAQVCDTSATAAFPFRPLGAGKRPLCNQLDYAVSVMVTVHYRGARDYHADDSYEDDLVRTPGGRRIAHRTLRGH